MRHSGTSWEAASGPKLTKREPNSESGKVERPEPAEEGELLNMCGPRCVIDSSAA